MRKLALVLCAAVGLSMLLTSPVYATGKSDVPPVAYSNFRGTVTVVEAVNASSQFTFAKSWTGSGWTGWATTTNNPTPAVMNGNTATGTGAFSSYLWTQLSDEVLYCASNPSDTWHPMTGPIWSVLRQDATPAVLTESGSQIRLAGVTFNGQIYSGLFTLGGGCDPNRLRGFFDTGGASNWTPAIAGTSESDYLMAATGTDGNEWWSYNGGPWTRTVTGGGPSGPALTTWGGGRYDIFVRGSDNALWHTSDPNAPNWESLGGGLQSGPGCASWAPNRIDCFVLGNDFAIWHILWDGAAWSAWESIGTA